MSLSLREETLIPFQRAPALLPKRPHIATLHRWRVRGVRGVVLETCLIGGTRYTSHEALQRFIDATTVAADGGRYGPLVRADPTNAGAAMRPSASARAASNLLDSFGI